MITVRTSSLIVLFCLLFAFELCAQDLSKVPVRGAPETLTTGQPGGLDILWGPSVGYHVDDDVAAYRLNLGMQSEFLMPQIGFLSVVFEGTVGLVGSDVDGALGTHLRFPYIDPGIEYNFRDRKAYFKLTALGAPRRGGLLGAGDRLRVDWVPATGLVQIGIAIQQPFETYRRNRPLNRHIYMSREKIPESQPMERDHVLAETLEEIKESMFWMDQFVTPRLGLYDPSSSKSLRRFDERAGRLKDRIDSSGRSFVQEDSLYHANLERAFVHAAGDEDVGASLAEEAERILLERVLVPTNRLFARFKKPVNLSAFAADAMLEFNVVVGRHSLTTVQQAAVGEVFRTLLVQTNSLARAQKERWDDSRLVWLPLNYGLRPEQYDTQPELNGVLEKLAGLDFTGCNDVGYLFNDDFYYFYKDLLLDTEHYQATIIHDFRNKTGKEFDRVGWDIVANGYIEAFIKAIEEMDQGKRDVLPEFFLFLDEFYYRQNRARKIITLLENLHDANPVSLKDKDLEERVRGQQKRLKEAIEASAALDRFGKDYVRTSVKVQVSVTHQFDPTFKEDALARDHRKIAFRDIFEEDPESGVAVFTGAGVGEYYLGPSWEDRSLILRGPDLVKLKTATRELFLSQGYRPDEVPFFLSERPYPPDYAERCRSLCERGWTTDALMTMNHPGFLTKSASVVKMALYNLMPRASVLLAPDSIWSSDYWASILVAAALRGVHVYAIAPGKDNAPSAAPPTLELIRQSLASMLRGVEVLGPEMKKAGGSLHVGVFAADYDVCSSLTRVEAFLTGEPEPHLAEGGLVFHESLLPVFAAERETLLSRTDEEVHVTRFGEDRQTKLHLKAQFFATKAGIEILRRPEWTTFLKHYLRHHRERCRSAERSLEGVEPDWLGTNAGVATAGDLVESFRSEPGASGAAYFVTIGSQNQDRRGMLLDGEVLVTIAGYESLMTLMDFAFFLKVSTWLETSEEVKRYFPEEGGFLKSVSKWIRNLI